MIWIVLDPDECPADPEETAEEYLLNRLAPEEAPIFENHYINYDRCARIVEQTNTCIVVMRRAAGRNGK